MSNASHGFSDGSEVFFVLKNNSVISAQKTPPEGFYIKGQIQGGRFIATSEVLGIGQLATAGRYGWLELNSAEFFPMESDQKADSPFVKGYITPQGFVPSERDVIDIP